MNDILERSPLFSGLKMTEIENLMEEVPYKIKHFNAGNMVTLAGEQCRALHVLLAGSVKGEMVDFSGRLIKIEDIEAPRPLAAAFLFGRNNRYPVTITANTDTRMLVLPRSSVMKLMQRNEIFLVNFLNAVSSRAQFISEKLRFLSFKSLKSKIAHYLLELDLKQQPQNRGGVILLDRTHDQLSNLFGVARPSLSRAIRELHNLGIIEVKGKKVRFRDKEALAKLFES